MLKTLNGVSKTYKWASDPGMTAERNGARIYFKSGSTSYFQVETLTKMGHQTSWGENQNSKQGEEYIESNGLFPGGTPALMPCIKVGINEWVVVNRGKHASFSLWTDGLSGCVAVAITTNDRAFLTHISSIVSVKDWQDKVAAQFLEAIKKLGDLTKVNICQIVISDDKETGLSGAVLKTLTGVSDEHLWESDPSLSYPYPGVRAHFTEGKLSAFHVSPLSTNGHLTGWGTNQNSEKGKEHIESQGFFPGGATADV